MIIYGSHFKRNTSAAYLVVAKENIDISKASVKLAIKNQNEGKCDLSVLTEACLLGSDELI